MASVHDQIITNQNNNTITKAEQDRRSGVKESSTSVNSQDFLQLMTMQLQYQDPMNPMDNSQMLAQEAQFSTLEQMENLTSSFSKFSTMFQANSLLGQTVEVTVEGKTSSGKVDYVDFSDAKGASIHIGDKNYPLSAVTKIYPQNDAPEDIETKNFFTTAVNSIANNLGYLAEKAYNLFDADKSSDVDNTTTDNNETNN